MKEQIKKLVVLGLALMMCLLTFSGCKEEINTGAVISEAPFYSLQAAYNEGLLKKGDLKKIAERHKDGYDKTLDAEIENSIKQAYSERYPWDGLETVKISEYCGTFNNCMC